MFEPRLALASLSGESDAAWARAGATAAGAAFLGGIALCDRSRDAARDLVARGRSEFLPEDPISFVDTQLEALADVAIRPGVNVRSTDVEAIVAVAERCHAHGALLEINAHCRQEELCAIGCGETLLRDTSRLAAYVERCRDSGAPVGVKVRAEVSGVDLASTARRVDDAGASFIHVDAMDSPAVIEDVSSATDLFVIANNGVRRIESVAEYVSYGADAVSIGRPSDDPALRQVVSQAVESAYESTEASPVSSEQ
ncbi:tRNA-dihydrouridine synthase [Halovivax gelatinilyticus]|uniref:tRNA-dihydrouridine synthase n=1 Tax=Halovivax gelatinilyticus TaxID=2961597 RepID=UPI0020CA66B2|nr:tRNA-dihydrouridine synthase [Halovivax gelatinilyticus]